MLTGARLNRTQHRTGRLIHGRAELVQLKHPLRRRLLDFGNAAGVTQSDKSAGEIESTAEPAAAGYSVHAVHIAFIGRAHK